MPTSVLTKIEVQTAAAASEIFGAFQNLSELHVNVQSPQVSYFIKQGHIQADIMLHFMDENKSDKE